MPSHRGHLLAVTALLAACGMSGCVERRYTIRTDPPGALAIVNGEAIGITPVSKSFVYYGDRTVRIVKEGYETLDIVQPVKAPYWDNLVTEFFTENLIPYTFRDELEFNYKLQPNQVADSNQVMARSEALRAEAQAPPKPRRRGFLGFFGF